MLNLIKSKKFWGFGNSRPSSILQNSSHNILLDTSHFETFWYLSVSTVDVTCRTTQIFHVFCIMTSLSVQIKVRWKSHYNIFIVVLFFKIGKLYFCVNKLFAALSPIAISLLSWRRLSSLWVYRRDNRTPVYKFYCFNYENYFKQFTKNLKHVFFSVELF